MDSELQYGLGLAVELRVLTDINATSGDLVKLRWILTGERTPKGVESEATAEDRHYRISGAEDSWTAVLKQGRKVTPLAEGSYGKYYNACTKHNREAQA